MSDSISRISLLSISHLSLTTPHLASSDYSVFRLVCRVYASIADVLGYMAGEGGIRAGPASNVAWGRAFALLDAAVKVYSICIVYVQTHGTVR